MEGHENTSTTLSTWTLAAQALDLAVRVYLVVLQDGHLNLLTLVLDFLGSVVGLLLALLGTTTKTQHQVEGGFLLDIIVAKCTTIF